MAEGQDAALEPSIIKTFTTNASTSGSNSPIESSGNQPDPGSGNCDSAHLEDRLSHSLPPTIARSITKGNPSNGGSSDLSVSPNTTTHDSSEYSADNGDEAGEKGHYRMPIQEKSKGKKKKVSGGSRCQETDFVYLAPEYRHKWTIKAHELDKNRNLTAEHQEQVRNSKLKSFNTFLQILPDMTESDEQRMTKLMLILTLETNRLQEYRYGVVIEATLHDSLALQTVGKVRHENRLAPGKNYIKLMVNLAKQEMVERSRSRHLELIVRVEVHGYLPQNDYECSDTDGYLRVQKKRQ